MIIYLIGFVLWCLLGFGSCWVAIAAFIEEQTDRFDPLPDYRQRFIRRAALKISLRVGVLTGIVWIIAHSVMH